MTDNTRTRYRVTGRYLRTVDGLLEETTSSFTTHDVTPVEARLSWAWNTLRAREGWVPFGPIKTAFEDPMQSFRGGRLVDFTVTPETYEACPRCGAEAGACGGVSNPHE
jgi:hypothetical protein